RELHRRLLRDGESPAAAPAGAARSDAAPGGAPPANAAPPANPAIGLPSALAFAPGPFVGRAAHLTAPGGALRAVSAGHRRLLLLAGEPGIGKTRLAAEFAASAHGGGALVLYGHCDEDAPIPFQPFVEALRHWAAAAPADELARLAGGAHEL